MKRRVSKEIRYREPELLRTGAEGFAEDGLGAAPQLHIFKKYAQAATGAPVIAQEY
jgi:hypothetical protein